MRIILTLLITALLKSNASGQEFISPPSYNLYPDSIAIFVKPDPKNAEKEANLLVKSSFGEQHFKTRIKDSVVLVPYYLLYDDEAMLVVSLEAEWGQRNNNRKLWQQFIKLRPMKKTDSLESAIYKALENPIEKNLITLAKRYEDNDCYGNASFVYHKLYGMGYRKYWNDFIKRNLHRSVRSNSVER